jgi:hypothetical protein
MGRGGGGQREGTIEGQQYTSIVSPWGQQFTSWEENTNHEWMYLQSINFVKHIATMSVTQSTYIGRDETGSVYLPTQLEGTLQLYW